MLAGAPRLPEGQGWRREATADQGFQSQIHGQFCKGWAWGSPPVSWEPVGLQGLALLPGSHGRGRTLAVSEPGAASPSADQSSSCFPRCVGRLGVWGAGPTTVGLGRGRVPESWAPCPSQAGPPSGQPKGPMLSHRSWPPSQRPPDGTNQLLTALSLPSYNRTDLTLATAR